MIGSTSKLPNPVEEAPGPPCIFQVYAWLTVYDDLHKIWSYVYE